MAKKKRSGIAWIVAAAAVVVLVAIALGWALGSRGNETAPPVATTSGTSGGQASSSSGDGEETDGICGLPVGSQEVPEAGPEATWEIRRGATVPTSKEYGPGIVKNGDRSCFAHNPLGAVFASANFMGLTQEAFLSHVTPGAYYDALAAADAGDPTPGETLTVRGFKVEQLGGDKMRVTLVTSLGGQAPLVAIPGDVVWADGDWKVDGEQTDQGSQTLTSLEGYVPWGP